MGAPRYGDKINGIYPLKPEMELPFPIGSAAAVTVATADGGNGLRPFSDVKYSEADIYLNVPLYTLDDPDSAGNQQKIWDLESIALHELGHVLGLYHVGDAASIMYPGLSPRQKKREIGPADAARLQRVVHCNDAPS